MDIKTLRTPSPHGPRKAHNATTATTVTMAASVAASQKSFRFPLEVSLNRNNFYTGPPQKPTSSRHHAITTPKERPRGKSKKKEKKKRALTPTMQMAKHWGLLHSDTECDNKGENSDGSLDYS